MEDVYLKCQGKIVFDPVPLMGDTEKMFKDNWVIITVPGHDGKDLGDYYRYLLHKRFCMHVHTSISDNLTETKYNYFGLRLQHPAWGSHISVCRGEKVSNWKFFKDKYNGQNIEFEYSISPKTNGIHWWLKVKCEKALDIREDMGLSRNGKWGLHLTLGSPTPQFEEKNKYILDLYMQGLMDNNN